MRDLARRYGWRAYALPLLMVVTVVALMTTKSDSSVPRTPLAGASGAGVTAGRSPAVSSPPVAPADLSLKSDSAGGSVSTRALAAGKLPPGPAYTRRGTGQFTVLPGTAKPVGTGSLFRYDVEVEKGISGVDVAQFSALVDKTLDDPRSWTGHGYRLQRVSDPTQATFHVSLTSAMTVRQYCGYDIPVETSCYAPAYSAGGLDVNRVVLNVSRWARGATPYVSDLATYHVYMINHEVGHALGHRHAHQCLPGDVAPVMMQQTFGLKDAGTGVLCQANPWPYPPGVKGAPGAEQADTTGNSEYHIGD